MTGRTVKKFTQIYMDGYALTSYSREIGPLKQEFDAADLTVLSDEVKGSLQNQVSLGIGTFNGVFDMTAEGEGFTPLSLLWDAGNVRNVMIPIGFRATVAAGDPTYCGAFQQLDFMSTQDGGAVTCTANFGEWDANTPMLYTKPWGVLVHPYGAETAVNSAVAPAGLNNGAASAAGGWLMYQVFAGDGDATIKIQDSATNANDGAFADLSGATSGLIDCSSAVTGIVSLGITAAVRQYLRPQIVFGTANTVTYALAFIRG